MQKIKRTVNKNLLFALIHYNGLTLETLAKSLNPPLSKSVLSRLCNPNHPHKAEFRIKEVSEKLCVPSEILFPYDLQPVSEEIKNDDEAAIES